MICISFECMFSILQHSWGAQMMWMKYKLIMFCYFRFLTEDATIRLGAYGNTGAIREHPFFRGMDWEALQQKCMEPPLNPHEVSGTDSVFISCH